MTPNHFMPFLWVHGESEETYRHMVNVIHDANIGAFCVEARPHPEFARDKWWQDLSVIVDEAKKLDMKVWILDDKHFPTGFAAGAVKDAPLNLKRRTIIHRSINADGGKRISISLEKHIHPVEHLGLVGVGMLRYANEGRLPKKRKQDELLICSAYGSNGEIIDLMGHITDGKLQWDVPKGTWTVEVCALTYDSGFHRDYINMIDEDSCRILIDAVYESHFDHFKNEFGKTIAGFFSDEPELGNGNYLKHYNVLGTDQSLPYSDALGLKLKENIGDEWKLYLPLLWKNDWDETKISEIRFKYMDAVTRLVEECFSRQIGMWCRDHGVEYIGHVIEDNNQHARTSTSLGHYFRGLKWQTMAGIDDIGGQVYPDGEDSLKKNIFGYNDDGEFYHFALAKLGSSMGQLNPNMQGRTMCEIFGNYGWSEGISLEKYLLDHFMVRGVNYFVPHAFTCKDYPDKDCPPHFYAHGHNPQYRHFGELMKYGSRICELISGGKIVENIAILYHGESEWAGDTMMMQKPGRILAENQIDFVYMPSDVFEEREFYKTKITGSLEINGRSQSLIIVPKVNCISNYAALGLAEFLKHGGRVCFIDSLPKRIATGEELPEEIKSADVVVLDGLTAYVKELKLKNFNICPADKQIRIMQYEGKKNLIFIVNEASKNYYGMLSGVPFKKCYVYNPWDNTVYPLGNIDGSMEISLDAHESMILIEGSVEKSGLKIEEPVKHKLKNLLEAGDVEKRELNDFEVYTCKTVMYPDFKKKRRVTSLDGYEKYEPGFSGIIRYETDMELNGFKEVMLEITEAHEGIEVFVNKCSLGISVDTRNVYDLTDCLKEGVNYLAIEVATTLERENGGKNGKTGLTGKVICYVK